MALKKNRRARGRSQVFVGDLKQGVGKLIGDQQLVAAGAVDVVQGEATIAAADVTERVVNGVQAAQGTAAQAIQELIKRPEVHVAGQEEALHTKQRQDDHQ